MNISEFLNCIGCDMEMPDFFAGVPDSQLKPLCNYIIEKHGISKEHIIAANEGNAVGMAAGYYLATGRVPIVYLQNSGLGNIMNPVASLMNTDIYGIPCIFIIGWRGEPTIKDEPQHIFQGQITLDTLDLLHIPYFLIEKDTSLEDVEGIMKQFREDLNKGKQVAFVVKKNSLQFQESILYDNGYAMNREEVLKIISENSQEDIIVSSTGKMSRELFEIRENSHRSHKYDFLTVGSMGHASSIALAISLYKPERRIWCIDGDGAALMHMGAMAVIGANRPNNLVHIIINNEAHETVGGMPTVSDRIDFVKIAEGCGYPYSKCIDKYEDLETELKEINKRGLTLLEIKAAIGSRADLGRPTVAPIDNKELFMDYLKEKNKCRH